PESSFSFPGLLPKGVHRGLEPTPPVTKKLFQITKHTSSYSLLISVILFNDTITFRHRSTGNGEKYPRLVDTGSPIVNRPLDEKSPPDQVVSSPTLSPKLKQPLVLHLSQKLLFGKPCGQRIQAGPFADSIDCVVSFLRGSAVGFVDTFRQHQQHVAIAINRIIHGTVLAVGA